MDWCFPTNLHNYFYLYNKLTSGVSDEGFSESINYDKMVLLREWKGMSRKTLIID